MEKYIPSYNLFQGNSKIKIEDIDYKNHYDFTQPHRHHYFELFFFETGGGHQLIDFENYEIIPKGIYLVCPGQIHLMKRHANANGIIVQFSNELMIGKKIPWYILSQGQFLKDEKLYNECKHIVFLMKDEMKNNDHPYGKEIISDYLKIILLKLFGHSKLGNTSNNEFFKFMNLLENKFKEWNAVHYYTERLGCSSKKLNELTKKHLGKTTLVAIHDRILLEAKRMMVANENISLKEIGYRLNFDSQSNFSNFIKNKTGKYPKELQLELMS